MHDHRSQHIGYAAPKRNVKWTEQLTLYTPWEHGLSGILLWLIWSNDSLSVCGNKIENWIITVIKTKESSHFRLIVCNFLENGTIEIDLWVIGTFLSPPSDITDILANLILLRKCPRDKAKLKIRTKWEVMNSRTTCTGLTCKPSKKWFYLLCAVWNIKHYVRWWLVWVLKICTDVFC